MSSIAVGMGQASSVLARSGTEQALFALGQSELRSCLGACARYNGFKSGSLRLPPQKGGVLI